MAISGPLPVVKDGPDGEIGAEHSLLRQTETEGDFKVRWDMNVASINPYILQPFLFLSKPVEKFKFCSLLRQTETEGGSKVKWDMNVVTSCIKDPFQS